MFRGFFKSSEAVSLPRPTPEHITKFFTPLLSTEIERSFCVTKVQGRHLNFVKVLSMCINIFVLAMYNIYIVYIYTMRYINIPL